MPLPDLVDRYVVTSRRGSVGHPGDRQAFGDHQDVQGHRVAGLAGLAYEVELRGM
jgi:hypothetical protein